MKCVGTWERIDIRLIADGELVRSVKEGTWHRFDEAGTWLDGFGANNESYMEHFVEEG